jgi:hypothetical protein
VPEWLAALLLLFVAPFVLLQVPLVQGRSADTYCGNVSFAAGEGVYVVVVSARDGAGNLGSSPEVTITLDLTPPVVTTQTSEAAGCTLFNSPPAIDVCGSAASVLFYMGP